MPTATVPAPADDAALAALLAALQNPVRIELLRMLRRERSLAALSVTSDGRPLSRQTISFHLNALVEAGLVRVIRPEGSRGALYVSDPETLRAAAAALHALAGPADR